MGFLPAFGSSVSNLANVYAAISQIMMLHLTAESHYSLLHNTAESHDSSVHYATEKSKMSSGEKSPQHSVAWSLIVVLHNVAGNHVKKIWEASSIFKGTIRHKITYEETPLSTYESNFKYK
jgi:hypothetical protein